MYFISQALRGAEERYPKMKKLAFAIVTAARKLKPYFQAHTINVLTDKPLGRAMGSPKAAGRMALWIIELSEFDIRYQPRAVVKGQILADFVAEFTTTKDQGVEEMPIWRVHTNGSSNKYDGGVGIVLHTPEGDKIECMTRLDFPTTNNETEYEALVAGLDLAIAAGAKNVVIYSDSQVVTSQVNGSYYCKNERMKRTTTRTPIGESPFRLAYGSKALIPTRVGLTSYPVENYDESKNDEALRLQLDLVNEVRAAAAQ
ncbi:uncharacterized protein LOC142625002 [Castanea sativa]|uniref:uncharacterized protein LOC142625002 n=1 Tax=Castanea sativa TaxID=21020 RepID=UPI003F64C69C